MSKKISEQQAMTELEKGYSSAEATLKDKSKLDDFLKQLEEKLKVIPKVGNKLSHVAVFAQMIKDYSTKKYDKIPMGSLIAIVSALAYVILPIDLIADYIPAVGYLDDAAIVAACLTLVESDVKDYLKWRDGIVEVEEIKEENKDDTEE